MEPAIITARVRSIVPTGLLMNGAEMCIFLFLRSGGFQSGRPSSTTARSGKIDAARELSK